MRRFIIYCLDTGAQYWYIARNAYEAMQKHAYYLNLSNKQEITINKTESGRHLFIEHDDKCYGVAV